jgi:phosphatidylserine/phosphatidylglycerophosphate/cardiolipin synthase-like enzyme
MNIKKTLIRLTVLVLICTALYHGVIKPLPDGVGVAGEVYMVPASSIAFYSDETYLDAEGVRRTDQQIFDQIIAMIDGAQEYVLVDMFLYNDFQGETPEETRSLSQELTSALVAKKTASPRIEIAVVTDSINTVYGGERSLNLQRLRDAGIPVVITDLSKLRDSNPLYSAFWRVFVQWFGNSETKGFLVHPFQYNGHLVTVRSYFALLNFKANHRKLVVADNGEGRLYTLVTSANPHDGSSAHSNTALVVQDSLWKDVIESERAVGVFSNQPIGAFTNEVIDREGDAQVQLLTEGAIRDAIVNALGSAVKGDRVDMAVFYLSDRSVVNALKEADRRGVTIRIILDPNKDAFSHEKNGVPNRPVADEIMSQTVGNTTIRWCDTHGEQCHTKMLIVRSDDIDTLILGSANFTRRNIGDFNLETDVKVAGKNIPAIEDANAYFDRMWNNESDRHYTVAYEQYAEESWLKTLQYHIMERTGLSTF